MNPIREAARQLSGHWHQGSLVSRDGRSRCGVGWLYQSTQMPSVRMPALNEMNIAAHDKFPDRIETWWESGDTDRIPAGAHYPFVQFNDHEQTTESDVLAVMDLAAERWDVERGT